MSEEPSQPPAPERLEQIRHQLSALMPRLAAVEAQVSRLPAGIPAVLFGLTNRLTAIEARLGTRAPAPSAPTVPAGPPEPAPALPRPAPAPPAPGQPTMPPPPSIPPPPTVPPPPSVPSAPSVPPTPWVPPPREGPPARGASEWEALIGISWLYSRYGVGRESPATAGG